MRLTKKEVTALRALVGLTLRLPRPTSFMESDFFETVSAGLTTASSIVAKECMNRNEIRVFVTKLKIIGLCE